MDIHFNLELDTADLKRQLQNKINERTKDIVARFAVEEFQKPGYWGSAGRLAAGRADGERVTDARLGEGS